MAGRIAGEASYYTWRLMRGDEATDYEVRLESSTSIIKRVMGASGGGMAWWGYKLGIATQHPKFVGDWDGTFATAPPKIDEYYKRAIRTGFHPNAVRDKAGKRGRSAHDVLEDLVKGQGVLPEDEEKTPWDAAVMAWWAAQSDEWKTVRCEEPVWSFKHGFQGTPDLMRQRSTTWPYREIVDLKTHSGDPRFEDFVQMSSYDIASAEMPEMADWQGADVYRTVLARLDGTFDEGVTWVPPEAFLSILEVDRRMKAMVVEKGAAE